MEGWWKFGRLCEEPGRRKNARFGREGGRNGMGFCVRRVSWREGYGYYGLENRYFSVAVSVWVGKVERCGKTAWGAGPKMCPFFQNRVQAFCKSRKEGWKGLLPARGSPAFARRRRKGLWKSWWKSGKGGRGAAGCGVCEAGKCTADGLSSASTEAFGSEEKPGGNTGSPGF